ncbi:Rv3235 family protein [Micromonospora sp. WMMA1998]|uniref:Rv3235 family protein n=1 Tax=Micromonospora sp. WMMA1998 TaxID=3015167 RepID=UPI00248CFA5B|nr:Rv3235 family protein [Micromonospora sp. WMMA1998]WBC14148.1 Rv3235 family protein [Micromonospora sp. WMMA1998]
MVDTRRPPAPRPPVRLRPAPPLDPPCTDEDPAWAQVGQLALDLVDRRPRDPARPAGRPPDRAHGWPRWSSFGPRAPVAWPPSAPSDTLTRPLSETPGTAVRPPAETPGAARPEAARAAHRFVRTFLEIVNGFRPPGQLRPLCLPEAVSRVSAEVSRAARRVTPVRRRTSRPALHLLRLRVCEPRAGAVEATAVFVGSGGVSWAVALRLEHRRGNWFCLVLDVL